MKCGAPVEIVDRNQYGQALSVEIATCHGQLADEPTVNPGTGRVEPRIMGDGVIGHDYLCLSCGQTTLIPQS